MDACNFQHHFHQAHIQAPGPELMTVGSEYQANFELQGLLQNDLGDLSAATHESFEGVTVLLVFDLTTTCTSLYLRCRIGKIPNMKTGILPSQSIGFLRQDQ